MTTNDYRQATEAELAEERRRIDAARAAARDRHPAGTARQPKLRLIKGGRH